MFSSVEWWSLLLTFSGAAFPLLPCRWGCLASSSFWSCCLPAPPSGGQVVTSMASAAAQISGLTYLLCRGSKMSGLTFFMICRGSSVSGLTFLICLGSNVSGLTFLICRGSNLSGLTFLICRGSNMSGLTFLICRGSNMSGLTFLICRGSNMSGLTFLICRGSNVSGLTDETLERTDVKKTRTTTAHSHHDRIHTCTRISAPQCFIFICVAQDLRVDQLTVSRRVFTRSHRGPQHPFARTHMAVH